MGEISREYIHFMKERTDVPVIFLDFYDKELANDAVITDNFYGMYLMTGYLFEQGFTKMAYVVLFMRPAVSWTVTAVFTKHS